MSTVDVRIDDRVRLLSALLSVTSWPDDEQARKPHGTHAHARSTRRTLQVHDKHPAALILQALLDRGVTLPEVFAYMVQLEWPGLTGGEERPIWAPPTWARHLLSFYNETGLQEWWEAETEVWKQCRREAEKMFRDVDFNSFMQPFVGDLAAGYSLVFMPNVCYPSDTEIGLNVNGELSCIAPPRIAWGDNPPWPFDEDPTHIYRAALTQYGRMLMRSYLQQVPDVVRKASKSKLPVPKTFTTVNKAWEDQFLALLGTGLVAIFLEDVVNPQEAQAYVLMEKKAQGVEVLPGVVSVLRRYLNGYGSQYQDFADYLPHFGSHLRVAKSITAL